jgi:hypothetical protein
VDAEEIGRLIADLENRVERLRSLYEQYFMGIERIEPLTARKDVDRRLWSLRREQIRNTGLRFKLETTIQRYNTYQQYWQRIVREIEAGTYQRDLGRAAQRFGDNAVTGFAKRRQKMFEKALTKKAERDALRHTDPGASQAPPTEGGEEAPPSSSESFDVTFEDSEAPEPASTRRPEVPIAQPIERLELDIGGSSHPEPPPLPARVPSPVEQRRGPPVAPPPAARAPVPAPPPRAPLASSSGLGVPQGPPPPRREIAATGARPAAPVTAPARAAAPAATAAKSWTAPVRAATPVATPARSAEAAPKAPAPPVLPAPPAATAGPRPTTSVLEKPAAPRPPLAAPALPKPAAPVAPIAPAVARPPAPVAPIAPAVARPAAPVAPIAPAVARPPAPVAPKPPAPAVRPPAPSRPEVSGPAVLGEDNSLSPIRMRQIYGAFVEAKRRANESTASVTYEKIAANLQNAAKELRTKHKARSVDFEVILKNGKPVLKPVVKS